MKNEYIISLHTKGLQCKELKSGKNIKNFDELGRIIIHFIFYKYTVKIDNNSLILENFNTKMVLNNYSTLIEYPFFNELKSSIDEVVKKDGFIDITNSSKLNRQINKTQVSKNSKIIKTTGAILTLIGFTSGVSLGLITNPDLIKEKEEIIPQMNTKTASTVSDSIQLLKKQRKIIENIEYLDALRELYASNYNYGYLNFTNKSNSQKAINARNNYYEMMRQSARRLGLDPELILAIATQESGLHSSNIYEDENHNKSGAVGLMQIMYGVWAGKTISYYEYNESTGTFESRSITITEDMLRSADGNIFVGSIIFQRCLISAKYNIPAAIQMYNQGVGGAGNAIEKYAASVGLSYNDVIYNPNDLGWVKYTHVSAGDPSYLSHVNSWARTNYFKVINVFNLEEVEYQFTNDPNFVPTVEVERTKTLVLETKNKRNL